MRLSKLTTASLDRYYRSLLVDGGRNGRPLAPGTVRRIHGILRRALAQGMRWGWLGVNPAASASPPRVPLPEIAPPTPAQLARLQAAIDASDPEFGVFVRASAMTGARRSEMLALRWPDVDLGRGVVTIGRGLVQGPDGQLVEKDTKTHQTRRVALDEPTTAALADHHAAAVERAGQCGAGARRRCVRVRRRCRGTTPWCPGSASRRFRTAFDDVGLEGVRLHDYATTSPPDC